jgi:hypothetical protein
VAPSAAINNKAIFHCSWYKQEKKNSFLLLHDAHVQHLHNMLYCNEQKTKQSSAWVAIREGKNCDEKKHEQDACLLQPQARNNT